MSTTTRYGIAVGFVAAVALAGAAFGQSGSPDPDRPPVRGAGKHGRIVTGTMTVQTDDGLVTRRIDAGTVTAVDAPSITIERADGELVQVAARGDTRVGRDGERAEVTDIEPGDHAMVVRVDSAQGSEVRSIRALSPEAFEERSAKAEEWRARTHEMRDRRQQMREEMRERFRQWRQDRQRV